jgi:hypothetical protein
MEHIKLVMNKFNTYEGVTFTPTCFGGMYTTIVRERKGSYRKLGRHTTPHQWCGVPAFGVNSFSLVMVVYMPPKHVGVKVNL